MLLSKLMPNVEPIAVFWVWFFMSIRRPLMGIAYHVYRDKNWDSEELKNLKESKDIWVINGRSIFSPGQLGSRTHAMPQCLLNSWPVYIRHSILEEFSPIISILGSLNSRCKSLEERGLDGPTGPSAHLLVTLVPWLTISKENQKKGNRSRLDKNNECP